MGMGNGEWLLTGLGFLRGRIMKMFWNEIAVMALPPCEYRYECHSVIQVKWWILCYVNISWYKSENWESRLLPFFQLYWGIVDKTVIYLKHIMWWFDVHIHYERIRIRADQLMDVNLHTSAHMFANLCVWKHLKSNLLANLNYTQ